MATVDELIEAEIEKAGSRRDGDGSYVTEADVEYSACLHALCDLSPTARDLAIRLDKAVGCRLVEAGENDVAEHCARLRALLSGDPYAE